MRHTLEASGKTVLAFQDSVPAIVEVILTSLALVPDPVKIAAQNAYRDAERDLLR